jgi:molecular chaperone GrpE
MTRRDRIPPPASRAVTGVPADDPLAAPTSSTDEFAALTDRYQRLAADFDSFRKRTARDTERSAAAQRDGLLRELLPVGDNLERALATHPSASAEQLRGGIEMTHQQLVALLKRHGVEAEKSLGETFDPHRHEAISSRFVPDAPDHAVVEVVQRGYRRGDEVVRPAQVIINDLELVDDDAHGGAV